MIDFEPIQASHGALCSIVDLCSWSDSAIVYALQYKHLQVCKDRSLVWWINRVSWVTSSGASERMVPFSSNLCACRDWKNGCWDWLVVWVDSTVADQIVGSDIRNGLSCLKSTKHSHPPTMLLSKDRNIPRHNLAHGYRLYVLERRH